MTRAPEWTDHERATLRRMAQEGRDYADIATRLGRTRKAVWLAAKKMRAEDRNAAQTAPILRALMDAVGTP
jgi:hypothetical protein